MNGRCRSRISWLTDDKPVLPAMPAEPPIPLLQARKAATLLSRFMAENADEFGLAGEFMFERKIAAPLSKMMIERLG